MEGMDILSPYKFHHGPRHGNRHIRECQKIKYGNSTHSLVTPHGLLSKEITLPIADAKLVVKEVGEHWNKRRVHGHVTFVNNPVQTVAVLEPLHQGTCQKGGAERATVLKSAEQRNCLVAVNAGFFNTKTGECLGKECSEVHFFYVVNSSFVCFQKSIFLIPVMTISRTSLSRITDYTLISH